MIPNHANFSLNVHFTARGPEMLIAFEEPDPLYKEAFFADGVTDENEYKQNTTTWD